ncbi:MAG: sigma-70 family RNA polymerase sigma factor [Planctomycetota bacterium]
MDSAQLEDICSEAIFKSLHAFHYSMGGDPVRSFISCAMTVARHVATACYRKQQRRVIVDPEVLEDQLATPTEQTVSDLYDALSRVDQIDAQVLRHYYFDGLSDREIGLELEFSRKKVSRIRRRALRSLRAEYLGESPMILDE